jgi:hypothetical protein
MGTCEFSARLTVENNSMIPEQNRSAQRIMLNRGAKRIKFSDKKNDWIVFLGLFLAYM